MRVHVCMYVQRKIVYKAKKKKTCEKRNKFTTQTQNLKGVRETRSIKCQIG